MVKVGLAVRMSPICGDSIFKPGILTTLVAKLTSNGLLTALSFVSNTVARRSKVEPWFRPRTVTVTPSTSSPFLILETFMLTKFLHAHRRRWPVRCRRLQGKLHPRPVTVWCGLAVNRLSIAWLQHSAISWSPPWPTFGFPQNQAVGPKLRTTKSSFTDPS